MDWLTWGCWAAMVVNLLGVADTWRRVRRLRRVEREARAERAWIERRRELRAAWRKLPPGGTLEFRNEAELFYLSKLAARAAKLSRRRELRRMGNLN